MFQAIYTETLGRIPSPMNENSNRQPFPARDVTVICTSLTDCLLLGWLSVSMVPPVPQASSRALLSFNNSVYLWGVHMVPHYEHICPNTPQNVSLYATCQLNHTCSGYWRWWNNFPFMNCVSILKLLKPSCDVLHPRGFIDPSVLSHGGGGCKSFTMFH